MSSVVTEVLSCYPPPLARSFQVLDAHGGFSGACLVRVQGEAGSLCLKGYPPEFQDSARLRLIHELMDQARQGGLDFVPIVLQTSSGESHVIHAGRLWELVTWMPGRADFREAPGVKRLQAACEALARLHLLWEPPQPACVLCPGIQRRIEKAEAWRARLRHGWMPNFDSREPAVAARAKRLWVSLGGRVDQIQPRLAEFRLPVPVQPCLCDVWHDHVLFTGEHVSGLIDYGSVKEDHVSVDLARLLGSLAEDDRPLWDAGLEAYHHLRPITEHDRRLARVLDETGAIVAALTWLNWLYADGRRFSDLPAVLRRLEAIARRLQ